MSRKRIYLIRHGQTDYNIEGIVQGRQINSELNEEGINQRNLVCKKFSDIQIDHIYLTSLKRTFQTMFPLIEQGVSYSIEKDLDELDFGDIEGKPIFDTEGNSILSDILTRWRNGEFDLCFPNGETPNEALKRVETGFKKLIANENENTILICLHQRILRIVMCYLLKKPLTDMDNYPHHNTGITTIDYDGEKGVYQLISLDNIDHLTQ